MQWPHVNCRICMHLAHRQPPFIDASRTSGKLYGKSASARVSPYRPQFLVVMRRDAIFFPQCKARPGRVQLTAAKDPRDPVRLREYVIRIWPSHIVTFPYLFICSSILIFRGTGRPRNTWISDLERKTWRTGFRFSWRKMETAERDGAEWRRVVCSLWYTGSDNGEVK